jgi:transposase
MTDSLEARRDWLLAEGVTIAAMESASTYWKAPFSCLEEVMDTWLLNAAHIQAVPGQDRRQGRGVDRPAAGVRAGPPVVRASSRHSPVADADPLPGAADGRSNRESTRLELMLEDASIKLSSVAASLSSVSARAMLNALIAGERDPAVLADLAKIRVRRKIPALSEALTGALQRRARPAGAQHAAPHRAGRGRARRAQRGHRDRLPPLDA